MELYEVYVASSQVSLLKIFQVVQLLKVFIYKYCIIIPNLEMSVSFINCH